MDRLLTKDEIRQLSSADGIISLLCNIENYNSENYDELSLEEKILINYTMNIRLLNRSQIDINLERSAKAHNLFSINERQLFALALLYFGVKDEKGRYVKYKCPYTGKEYDLEELKKEMAKPYKDRDKDKILELEHIIPHSMGGGTTLFNCIPVSREANSTTEKGSKSLLDWLESSGYYNTERISKLVNYIISAYEIAFYDKEEELEFENDDLEENEELDLEEFEAINENEKELDEVNSDNDKTQKTNTENTNVEGYLPFINQLISRLNQDGYNTNEINSRVKGLEVFKNIEEKYKIVQTKIEELFKRMEPKSYLTYSLKIDYKKLVLSIETDDPEEINVIIEKRFKLIQDKVKDSGKIMNDYFESLRDIRDVDLLYLGSPDEEAIVMFGKNIKIGHKGKIKLFIEMLGEDDNTKYSDGEIDGKNIFGAHNKVPFKGYGDSDGVYTSQFWRYNSTEIKDKIQELKNKNNLTEEEKKRLEKAERAIECYEFYTNLDKRIECFIDMLAEAEYTKYKNGVVGDENILGNKRKVKFKGYEDIDIDTSRFWDYNSDRIKQRIEDLKGGTKEEREKAEKAEKAIKIYEEFYIDLYKRIECFIDMLAEDKYTRYDNGKPDKENILKEDNKVLFEGYEGVGRDTSQFWRSQSDRIKQKIKDLKRGTKEEREKAEKAEKAIDCYEFQAHSKEGLERRIRCFIDMLAEDQYTKYEVEDKNGNKKKNDNIIFSDYNKVPFKGYETIEGLYIGQFWFNHKPDIKKMIEALKNKDNLTKEEKDKLEKAEKAIEEYEFRTNTGKRIDCLIEMLSEEKIENQEQNVEKILSEASKASFKGYESIKGVKSPKGLWKAKSVRIIALLFYNLDEASEKSKKDNNGQKYEKSKKDYSGKKYDRARRAILGGAKDIDTYIEQQKGEKKRRALRELREAASKLTKSKIDRAGKELEGILENDKQRSESDGQKC